MDPYKVLGISARQVKHPSDLDKVRHRAKQLFRRHNKEGKKFDAKKVLEAFQLVEQRLKDRPGEGQYKILGRSRKERELDKHFNHQTKEIKKDKKLKKELKKRALGSDRGIHLPGDKERIPKPRRRRHHRKKRKRTQAEVNILEGLQRLAGLVSQESKFPKVIKLLHRWMKDYMNVDNREYIFKVLHGVANCSFLTDDPETRQDVICVFEYVLGYFTQWFEKSPDNTMFGQSWQISTVLASKCFTDDAFVLSSTIGKLNNAYELLEKQQDHIGVVPKKEPRTRAKKEEDDDLKPKLEAKEEDDGVKSESDNDSFGGAVKKKVKKEESGVKDECKTEVKAEEAKARRPLMAKPLLGMAGPVLPPAVEGPAPSPSPMTSPAGPSPMAGPSPFPLPSPLASPSPLTDGDNDLEVLSSDGSDCVVGVESDDDEEVMDVGSDGDSEEVKVEEIGIDSGGSENGEAADGASSEGEVEEVPGSVFATPHLGESLEVMRAHFVDRCLAALFKQRNTLWARPKIDAFFQDLYYRRSILTPEQQQKLEAWQSRIKTNQRLGERAVGEANNPLEAHRPVVDSRETKTFFEAAGGAWSAKQTFDSREASAGKVIR